MVWHSPADRVKMLKDARASAEEELKAFRLKEEERFKVEVEQVRQQLHSFRLCNAGA